MRKLTLPEWAAVAEITGTIAVVISLLMVVYSLDRNTVAISATVSNEIYDGFRDIQNILLENPDVMRIVVQGADDPGSLSEMDREFYWTWVSQNLDLWDRMSAREREGLIDHETAAGWNAFFNEWTGRYVTRELWEQEKWGWPDDQFRGKVEAALDH